jgi:hypothetical protein
VILFCAFLLARHRHGGGSLIRAAFLSARNDAVANVQSSRGPPRGPTCLSASASQP